MHTKFKCIKNIASTQTLQAYMLHPTFTIMQTLPLGKIHWKKEGTAANGKGQMSVQRGAANKAPDMTVI